MKLITLTKGKFAKVDDEWFEELNQYKWCCDGGYARRLKNKVHIHMHRVVNQTPEGFDTDHIDGDRLNNQSANLRTATRTMNMANQSFMSNNKLNIKGVRLIGGKHFTAQINVKGKRIHLGTFDTIDEASAAYDAAAMKYFGDFANTNNKR